MIVNRDVDEYHDVVLKLYHDMVLKPEITGKYSEKRKTQEKQHHTENEKNIN